MHHAFNDWVYKNEDRFRKVLKEGYRLCGEWLHTAHGTIYDLPHEPFVAFDLISESNKRTQYSKFVDIIDDEFVLPYLVSSGGPMSVDDALDSLGEFGYHGAQEQIEGAMWRVERNDTVDYLCKYVRPGKVDGKYLDLDKLVLNTWR